MLPAQEIPPFIRRPAYAAAADGRPQVPGHETGFLPPYVDADPTDWALDPSGEVQSPAALERMRKVCKLAATALKIAMNMSQPGDSAIHETRFYHRSVWLFHMIKPLEHSSIEQIA